MQHDVAKLEMAKKLTYRHPYWEMIIAVQQLMRVVGDAEDVLALEVRGWCDATNRDYYYKKWRQAGAPAEVRCVSTRGRGLKCSAVLFDSGDLWGDRWGFDPEV